jgi:hypothetical protein
LTFTLFKLVSSTLDLLKTEEGDKNSTAFRETVRPVIYSLIKSHLSLEEHKVLPCRLESLGTATSEAYTNYCPFSGDPPISGSGETETNGDMVSYLLRGFPNGMRSFGALHPSSDGVEDRHEFRHGCSAIQQLVDARFVNTAGTADYAELEVSRVENMFTSAGRWRSVITVSVAPNILYDSAQSPFLASSTIFLTQTFPICAKSSEEHCCLVVCEIVYGSIGSCQGRLQCTGRLSVTFKRAVIFWVALY